MYSIKITSSARKDLDKLSSSTYEKVINIILALEETPTPKNSNKLAGYSIWRIWIGDLRILYKIEEKTRTITISRIKHRRDVYRNL